MGYCLARHDESCSFNISGWAEIKKVARENGWNPQGTLAPLRWNNAKLGDWEGGYGSNDWQIVTAEDADALASALEKALPTLTHESERWREKVQKFIAFCREGGFEIA